MPAALPSSIALASLIDALRGVLVQVPEVWLALLFGSQATGKARADSDVDIAFLGHIKDRLDLSARLSQVCAREVDLVSLHDPSFPLLEEVIRDGVLIYEADANVYSTWRSRALSSLDLDQAWYYRMRDAWLTSVAERGL